MNIFALLFLFVLSLVRADYITCCEQGTLVILSLCDVLADIL